MRASIHVPRLLCALLVLSAALPAFAAAQQDSLRRYRLDTVQVTSKRYPALRTEIPQKIEVIGEQDVRRTPAAEIVDVLKKQNAVDVIQYPGLLSGIGIRGFKPEFSWINQRTLILIDGRPAGVTNLSTLDMNAVERIEILKGPASSLYGSSAMGGAVNLITRRSTAGLSGSGAISYGTWRTLEVNGRVGGRVLPRVDMDLSFGRFSRDRDYRLGDGNVLRGLVGSEEAVKVFADSLHPVAEVGDGQVIPNTQFTWSTASGRVGVQLGGAVRADARGEWFRADDVEGPPDLFASFDPGQRKNLERTGGEVSLGAAWGRHAPLLRAYAGREDSEYFNLFDPDPFISFTSRLNSGGLQFQDAVRLGEHALTAGVDAGRMEATSQAFSAADTRSRPFSPDAEQSTLGVFAEGRLVLLDGRLIGTLGGRYDRIVLELKETPFRTDLEPEKEAFGIFNPSLGLQYEPAEGVRLHGTVGRAFVSPDAVFKAGLGLSSTSTGGATITLGNPALDAERSLTWDVGVGISRPRSGIDADVTYFHTAVENRISQVTAVFPAAGRPRTTEGVEVGSVTTWVNAADATMSGLEGRLGYDLGVLAGFRYSLRVFGNATHFLEREETVPALSVDASTFAGRTDFRPEEVTQALVPGPAARRDIRNVATRTITYGAEYDDLRRFSARFTGRYVGERLDLDFSDFANITDIRYPAFMTLDLATTVRVTRSYSVALLVSNLTDENYYEKRGFNLPGRSLQLTLTADF